MLTLLEETYAGIYKGYLSQDLATSMDDDHDAVWPPVATVPRTIPSDEVAAQIPSIAIYCVEEPGHHPQIAKVELIVHLKVQYREKPNEEADPRGTDLALARQWFTALEIAIKDDEAFAAYVLSLPENQRTGGCIMERFWDNSIRQETNAAERSHTMELRITNMVDTSPED